MGNSQLFQSVVDVDHLDRMFKSFYKLTKVPITLVQTDGEILKNADGDFLGAGWQTVCTDFHRINRASKVNCRVSDSFLAKEMQAGKDHAIYKCLNGLIDIAVPIIYKRQIVANLFSGQFFLSEPEMDFFAENARRYNYDEAKYIKAVKDVQVFSSEKVDEIIEFLKSLSHIITGYLNGANTSDYVKKRYEMVSEVAKQEKKKNEVITSTILSLDSYVYSLDEKHHFENYVGPFKIGFFGETIEELKGQHYSSIVCKSIQGELKQAIEQVSQTSQPSKFIFSKNKEYYHASLMPRYDSFGHLSGSALQIKEVTNEVETLYNVEKLTVAVEQSPVSIVVTDKSGHIEYVNSFFLKSTGYSKDEVLGKNPRILKSGRLDDQVYEELWSTISKGETWKGELINRKKNGDIFWESSVISPVIIHGEIEYFVAIKEDITNRKKMEKALHNYKTTLERQVVMRTKELQESHHNFKEIVEHLSGIVWEVDLQGIIHYISPTVSRYSEYDAKELLGKPVFFLFAPELHGKLYEFINNFSSNPHEFSDFDVFLDKGKKRSFLKASGRPIYDGKCNLVGVRGISLDYTQQKERDTEILTAIWNAEEKQKAFIAMELHDSIGSSLSAASIYMNMALKNHSNDSTILKVDHIIKDTAREVRLIARQLRPPELERLGLEGGLNNLKQLYENNEKIRIEITTFIVHVILPPQLELAVYRIVSELINNSIKHGGADLIKINVFVFNGTLYVLFEDYGNGELDVSEEMISKGIGIKNIRNRVKAFDGICNFFSIPGQGVVVGIEMESKQRTSTI